jgi:prepilin-type N-terminal cleavage/methylation domain-containing protein
VSDNEAGFTLIELLVAILILGIILGPLTGAIILGLNTTDDTIQRLAESVDAQNASSLFISDVQSASTISVTDGGCVSSSVLISFRWTDHGDSASSTADDVNRVVTYFTEQAPTQERAKDAAGTHVGQPLKNLIRRSCTPNGTLTVASFLRPNPAPVVACVPAPPGCVDKPTFVSITATEVSGYEFVLSAKRRSL